MSRSDLQHRSFRLSKVLLERLRRHSARQQASQTLLVERYIAEGIAMDSYPMIIFRDSPVGRRAMLEGTRLDVAQVVETIHNEGGSIEAAAAYLSLTPVQVRACVRYFADHRDEVVDYAERIGAENARLRAAWEREQAVLV